MIHKLILLLLVLAILGCATTDDTQNIMSSGTTITIKRGGGK